MERAFHAEIDAKKLLELYQKELEIKKEKKQIHNNKKLLRKRVMARYIQFLILYLPY